MPTLNFLEHIFETLRHAGDRPVVQELRGERFAPVSGRELLEQVHAARRFLTLAGLRKGDRCALLAHNSIRWAAVDLALMAEGVMVVPLYARQAPAELVGIMKDCRPSLILCGDAPLAGAIAQAWPEVPRRVLFDEVFAAGVSSDAPAPPVALVSRDPVTIIYTSGTSGEAKGVMLTAGNLDHMLSCTTARLDLLRGRRQELDRVFHYLPFCFAGSWVMLLTCLSRASVLTLSTDLSRLAEEMRLADPHYFLNVPTLLERVRSAIGRQLDERGGAALALFQKGEAAWLRRHDGTARGADGFWIALAKSAVFPAIRRRLPRKLEALICGSAPLARETQLFFLMLGVRVLQVYGLTETTAICTMDHPEHIEPGRVGPAIAGTEMKLGENDEILVRGPNIFPGYWNRPQETAKVLRNGWFHTGDQGEISPAGNWRITGRLKNLIILNSGHNIAPEPLEETLLRKLAGAQQVVLVGNGRSYLSAMVAGEVAREQVEAAIAELNAPLPHYQRIRSFWIQREPFSIENGLLTANGKLKRDAIAARFAPEIEKLYREKSA